jgi:hypothetical protein
MAARCGFLARLSRLYCSPGDDSVACKSCTSFRSGCWKLLVRDGIGSQSIWQVKPASKWPPSRERRVSSRSFLIAVMGKLGPTMSSETSRDAAPFSFLTGTRRRFWSDSKSGGFRLSCYGDHAPSSDHMTSLGWNRVVPSSHLKPSTLAGTGDRRCWDAASRPIVI